MTVKKDGCGPLSESNSGRLNGSGVPGPADALSLYLCTV